MQSKITKLILLFLPINAGANCLSDVEVATNFFSKHHDFYAQDPTPYKSEFTKEFYLLTKSNFDCAVKNSGLCVDYDPWAESNSIILQAPSLVQSLKVSENESKVKMVFKNDHDPFVGKYVITDYLILKREVGSCWKVHDLISSTGESISEVFRQEKNL